MAKRIGAFCGLLVSTLLVAGCGTAKNTSSSASDASGRDLTAPYYRQNISDPAPVIDGVTARKVCGGVQLAYPSGCRLSAIQAPIVLLKGGVEIGRGRSSPDGHFSIPTPGNGDYTVLIDIPGSATFYPVPQTVHVAMQPVTLPSDLLEVLLAP